MEVQKVREIYAELDAEWKRAVAEYEQRTGYQFPCSPGCDDCCRAMPRDVPFIFTLMNRAEAEVLWEALIALPPETRQLVINRQLLNYTDSCILLSDEGLCLVYEGRPWWCRIFGLSGMPTCGKIPPAMVSERWFEAVAEAHEKLREYGEAVVPLRELIDRLQRR